MRLLSLMRRIRRKKEFRCSSIGPSALTILSLSIAGFRPRLLVKILHYFYLIFLAPTLHFLNSSINRTLIWVKKKIMNKWLLDYLRYRGDLLGHPGDGCQRSEQSQGYSTISKSSMEMVSTLRHRPIVTILHEIILESSELSSIGLALLILNKTSERP